MDTEILEKIGYDDKLLIEYIQIKNDIKPFKNSIDYILYNRLVNTELGELVLNKNNLISIDDEIYKIDFRVF